ncbi:MAG: PqqD family protein [Candidatus Omnitrophica bacterium]|nr:PqqD family protein [Candidatus Omnitrophota bacterium]
MFLCEHVKIRDEKFGSVIFETLREKVYVTNETGKDILAFLKEGVSTEGIMASMVNKYNEDRMVVEKDVKDFIAILIKNRLVSDGHSF